MEKTETDIPQIELLTPLTAEFHPDYREWEDDEPYGEPLNGADLVRYRESIQERVDKENDLCGNGFPCNLMDYFDGSPAIKEKVASAVVSVKEAEGVLYGCTTLELKDFLDAAEMKELCDYITGQYNDGWGEGFEQRDIEVDGGTLNVHFWQWNGFCFKEQEKAPPDAEKQPQTVRKPKLQLLGHDGNIFSIMGDARRLLRRNGQQKEAEEMWERVQGCGDYYKALGIISEYVETELSSDREKVPKAKKKNKGEECR